MSRDDIFRDAYSGSTGDDYDALVEARAESERWQEDARREHQNARYWQARAEQAEEETIEQARLNGMGSEREARLLARVAELEAERDAAKKALEYIHTIASSVLHGAATGQQAGISPWNMTVGTKKEILRTIDAALVRKEETV